MKSHDFLFKSTATVLTVAIFIYSAGFLFTGKVLGASYVFTQSSWSGGTDGGTTGIHPTNQNDWTTYSAKDANLSAGAALSLSTVGYTATDDGTLTTTGSATGGGFANGTFSQTVASGSGDLAGVVLSLASGGWTTTSNPSSGDDRYTASAMDSSGIYLAGFDSINGNLAWHIQKRSKTDGTLITGFGTNGVISENITAKWENISSIAVDSSYLYIGGWYTVVDGGFDEECSWVGDTKWRVEKRDKTTGALVNGFGTGGILDVDPSANASWGADELHQIRLDGSYIYLAGFQTTTTAGYCTNWDAIYRFEKRNIGDGSLVAAFGSAGVVMENLAGSYNTPVSDVVIDDTSMYLALTTYSAQLDWRIEKRNLVTGALDSGFDSDGILDIADNGATISSGLALSGTSLYILGEIITPNDYMIQKRDSLTGALDSSFGVSGSVAVDALSISKDVYPNKFLIGPDGLYMTAHYGSAQYSIGNSWYVEKRDLNTGSLNSNFGTNGILTTGFYNDFYGQPTGFLIDTDTNSFYWSGFSFTGTNGNNEMRVEKRSLATGGTTASYNTPGTFTSASIDTTGSTSWGNISWTSGGGQTITMKARSGNQANLSDATDWASCTNITSGQALSTGGCVTNGQRYIQYQAVLSTSNTSVTPSLDSVTIGYNSYPTSQTLTSSAYNANDPTNVVGGLSWTEDETLPTGTTVTLSLRSAETSGGLTGASWTDFTNATANCTKASGVVTCSTSSIPSGMKDGTGDQWMQYKVTIGSTGGSAPTVSGVTMTYVVNASPEFDATFGTNGVTVSEVSDSGSANWGKVEISYKVRDLDTSTGNPDNRYKVTPSFAYNIGAGWVTITAPYLGATDLETKTVADDSYNTYTAVWDARSQIPNIYNGSAQLRVTVSDGELANATKSAIGAAFILDTKPPTVSTLTGDSSTDTLTLSATDDSNIQYILSNNSELTADGANASSGTYQNVGATSVSVTPSWAMTGSPSFETVYSQVRDIYGNATTRSITMPGTPSGVDIKDVSNVGSDVYREFLSWDVFLASTSVSYFNQYQIYRSTDNATFSSLATVTSTSTNYYLDTTVASTSTYYYKMRVRDHNGNLSNFSAVRDDTPNGQGGSDITAPTITAVTASPVEATWATVTWTTDELANSSVSYRIGSGAYTTVSSDSMVTSHSMTLTGLTPETQYQYRVTSADPLLNSTTNNNNGNNYNFTTATGPSISAVTTSVLGEQSATITWNTTVSSDSYVYYSTSLANLRNNISVSQTGSASLVSGSESVYPHSVSLSSLSENTTYYYYVKSTDGSSNTVTNTNGSDYYSFTTTQDNLPPVISNIGTAIITSNSVVITWDTNELSDSQVIYGTSAGNENTSTTLQATSTINHAETITGLTAETVYYYKVKSKDTHNNLATSDEKTFTSARAGETIIVYVSSGGGGSSVTVDSTKPTISSLSLDSVGAFEATISFDTNEDTVAFIPYGRDEELSFTGGSSSYKKKHTISLRGLSPDTRYFYKAVAIDKGGNTEALPIANLKTKFVTEALQDLVDLKETENFQKQLENIIESTTPSLLPPIILNLQVTNITESSAIISWQTNVPSYSGVAYISDFNYKPDDGYSIEVGQMENKTKNHAVELKNLSGSTQYHLQARSYVFPSVVGKSKDLTFSTKTSRIRPEVSGLGNTNSEIRWNTDTKTSSFVEFKDLKTGKVSQVGDKTLSNTHSVKLDNLTPNTSYEVRAYGYDANNNQVEGDMLKMKTKIDITPPIISNEKISSALLAGNKNSLQTIVSWKTDEPATSEVYYEEGVGKFTEALSNKILKDEKELTTEHVIILTNFKPSTVYRIKLASTDSAVNIASTSVRTIFTPSQSESVVDVIVKNFEKSFGVFMDKK